MKIFIGSNPNEIKFFLMTSSSFFFAIPNQNKI